MPTKTEIIEAGAAALHEDNCPADYGDHEPCGCSDWLRETEVALEAMLPLIKQALAEEVWGNHIKDAWVQDQNPDNYEEWFDVGTEHAFRVIEEFEL